MVNQRISEVNKSSNVEETTFQMAPVLNHTN